MLSEAVRFDSAPPRREGGLPVPERLRGCRIPGESAIAIRPHELNQREVVPFVIPARVAHVVIILVSRHVLEHAWIAFEDVVHMLIGRHPLSRLDLVPALVDEGVKLPRRHPEHDDLRMLKCPVEANGERERREVILSLNQDDVPTELIDVLTDEILGPIVDLPFLVNRRAHGVVVRAHFRELCHGLISFEDVP